MLVAVLVTSGSFGRQTAQQGEPDVIDKSLEGAIHAPDFPDHLPWLNIDQPLSLEDLRGKLVLLDFWTFCCINCLHVLPDLKELEEKYPEELVVIGVHSAKFTNEKDTEAIRQAILRYEINHPVINDYDFDVWRSYGTRAWPTLVLINPKGNIIGSHSGEGVFEPFDAIISKAITYFDARGELKRSPLANTLERERQPNTVLSFPGKVSADTKSKRIFISDSNHNRILITDQDGEIFDVIGTGAVGTTDGSFEEARLHHPQGTFLRDNILYIADTENHLIRAADLDARRVTTVAGTGIQASSRNESGHGTDVALNSPWALIGHGDRMYIAMAGPHQLWSFDPVSGLLEPYAGSGREDIIDGPLQSAALAQPSGITTDGKVLYFADSEVSAIRSADLNPTGRVNTIVGAGLFEYGDIDGPADVARLQHPLGIAYHDGLLYVADTYNSKIKIVDPKTRTVRTFAGTGEAGLADGPADRAQFNEPSGLAVLGNELLVADANNHAIRTVDLPTGVVRTLPLSGMDRLTISAVSASESVVALPGQEIAPGDVRIRIRMALPPGFKPVTAAPAYLQWQSSDSSVVGPSATAVNSNAATPLSYDLTVAAAEGRCELRLNAVVYFCEEANEVCRFDEMTMSLPITVGRFGQSEIEVPVTVHPTPGM
ncbi:MAG: redoxin domain-containing protein [candidate division Zixibacteria bacterium]|nr:redoxin domain-containing protein [candidate division Zixibacteria bacterium]